MGWSTMASWCPKDSTAGEAMGAQVKKGNVTNTKSGRGKQKRIWGGVSMQRSLQCSSGIRRESLVSSTFPPTSPGKRNPPNATYIKLQV